MLFNSLQFLIFLPIVLLLYYTLPQRLRYLWLLAASYYFYMCWNASYALLIFFSTAVTWGCGLILERAKQIGGVHLVRNKRICLAISCVLNFGVLFFFKYCNFALTNIARLFLLLHIELNLPVVDVLLPVGISFYTFQAVSYTIDVYRDDIYAEKNFFRYALFVSFFPQLVAGPIERSKNLLKQLAVPTKLKFDNLRDGLLLMIWGFFLKVVIADRASVFVDTVYGDLTTYSGWYFIIATLFFAVQIYCDFSGYSVIAMGAAKMLGIDLMLNFDAPYFSSSTAEFWRRWHISLSSWFRDYLYIPLGGNRKGKLRKYLNLLITFAVSGLWHGAQWSYVAWGTLNGMYQIIGDILKPLRMRLARLLYINPESLGSRVVKVLFTFILIDFSWIFFRADRFVSAFTIIKSILTVHNPWILFDGSLYECGLSRKTFSMLVCAIIFLLLADLLKLKKVCIRQIIEQQDYWCQILIIACSICAVMLFGMYGPGFDAASFIYFQF